MGGLILLDTTPWGTLALAMSKVHYLVIITVDPYVLLLLSLNTSSHVIELSHALHFMCQICGIGIMSESVRFHTIILHVPDLWCGQGLPDSSTTNVGVADAHPVKI